jgi:lipopolysaccharide transport system ATP-binding protein
MSDIAIRVQNVSKCYQVYDNPRNRLKQFILPRLSRILGKTPQQYFSDFLALNDVSFEIKKGETVGIIGRNGSGKSTLLQIICGTLFPTAGSVETNGRIAALLELGAGFNPEFTGRENVYMNASIMGLKQHEVDAKFAEIAAFAEIGEFIERPVKMLSSGMYVRLAFAVQVCVNPDILIVDEALAVGDAYFVHRCFHRIRDMKARGKTIIFVSHDANSVKNLCDRAILLEAGKIISIGKPDEVVTQYRARLFGVPQKSSAAILATGTQSEDKLKQTDLTGTHLLPEQSIPNIDYRMGGGRCLVQGVGIYDAKTLISVSEVEGGADFILRITIKNITLPKGTPLIVGYVFRGLQGEEISAVNTVLENLEVSAPSCDSTITIRATITLPYLYTGNYAMAVAVRVDELDAVPEDRVENAIVFGVRSSCDVSGQMRFPTDFAIEE